ncbi:MAG: aminotransferase class V-fold PLP-dependent enzyme, partial [Planctomycetaceae bacterium]
IEPLASRCHALQIPFHLDAVQAVGKIPVDFDRLGVTTLALGAHKFHGPRGIGALLIREGTRLAPYLFGGHQEAGRRPGTEPVALIAGMTRALSSWHAQAAEQMRRVEQLRDLLEHGLLAACGSAVVHGRDATRLPNTLNIAFPGLAGEALLVALDLEGVACSLGSTCASGSAEPAPVLIAMGCPHDVSTASVRFSLSTDNTEAEIRDATARISTVVNRLRVASPIGN